MVFVIIPGCVVLISGFFALILLVVECDVANAHGDEACQDVIPPASPRAAPAHTNCARPCPPVPDLCPPRYSYTQRMHLRAYDHECLNCSYWDWFKYVVGNLLGLAEPITEVKPISKSFVSQGFDLLVAMVRPVARAS